MPYEVNLKKKENWRRIDSDKDFDVVRLHYYCKSRDLLGSLQVGAPVAEITTTPGSIRIEVVEHTRELEVTKTLETTRNILAELEASERLVNEISAAAKVSGVFDLSANTMREITQRYRFQASTELHDSTCVHETKSINIRQEITVDGDKSPSPLYLTTSYRKVGYDVYLAFIDHLHVSYKRRGLQIRPRRVKSPPAPLDGRHWQRASNVSLNLNIPIKTLWFWELIRDRYPERGGGYQIEVPQPHECTVSDLNVKAPTYSLPTEAVPSLYQLSSDAFQLKWSKSLRPSEP